MGETCSNCNCNRQDKHELETMLFPNSMIPIENDDDGNKILNNNTSTDVILYLNLSILLKMVLS